MDRNRARVDSKSQSNKCAKRCIGDNDRISGLPDDILLAIMSFLSLREAACTSVLSSHWINLWKHTPRLNFDVDSMSNKIVKCSNGIEEHYSISNRQGEEYVKWVNSIIRSHKAVNLEEFRICFPLRGSAKKAIPRWLNFAFMRHIQRLELDCPSSGFSCSPSKECVFPEEFLTQISDGASKSRLCSDASRIDFKSLKALSLKSADVTSETIKFFLRNCPLLQKLVVGYTNKISNLEVCGPSLVLKHFELQSYYMIESIKVSAPNLTSLIVPRIEGLLLENVPMLVQVSVQELLYPYSLKLLLPALSCCIFQLEIVKFKLETDAETDFVLSRFPELPKLKKLVIQYSVKGDKSLMGLTSLIRASPYLQEFVITLSRWGKPTSGLDGEVKNTINFPHHHLKVVKFSGYEGCASDDELFRYISENCVVLEKIIIDAHDSLPDYYESDPDELNEIETARDLKQQLEALVPQHVELVFSLT